MLHNFNIRRGKDGRGQVCTLLERWRGVRFLLSEFPNERVALPLWTTLGDYLLRDSCAQRFRKIFHHVWCDGRSHLRLVLPLSVIVSRSWGPIDLISVFATTTQRMVFGGHTLSHGLEYFLGQLLILNNMGILLWYKVAGVWQLLIRNWT